MILVAGATGLVGSAVCQKLAKRGETVRALVSLDQCQRKAGRPAVMRRRIMCWRPQRPGLSQ